MTTEILLKHAIDQRERRQRVSAVLKDYDLTTSQWTILGLIKENPGIRISDISKRALTSMAFATTTVNYLKARGLVGVEKTEADFRSKRLHSTCEWFDEAEKKILEVI